MTPDERRALEMARATIIDHPCKTPNCIHIRASLANIDAALAADAHRQGCQHCEHAAHGTVTCQLCPCDGRWDEDAQGQGQEPAREVPGPPAESPERAALRVLVEAIRRMETTGTPCEIGQAGCEFRARLAEAEALLAPGGEG